MGKSIETVSNISKENGLMVAANTNQAALVEAMSNKDKSLLKVVDNLKDQNNERLIDVTEHYEKEAKLIRENAELKAENKQLKESEKKVIIETGTLKTKKVTERVHTGYDTKYHRGMRFSEPTFETVTREVPVEGTKVTTVNMEEAEHQLRTELRKEFEVELQEKRDLELEVQELNSEIKELKSEHKAELKKVRSESARSIEEQRQDYLDRSARAERQYEESTEQARSRFERRRIELEANFADLTIEFKEKNAKLMRRIERFKNNVLVRLFGLNKALNLA